jgi:hypothetical protein
MTPGVEIGCHYNLYSQPLTLSWIKWAAGHGHHVIWCMLYLHPKCVPQYCSPIGMTVWVGLQRKLWTPHFHKLQSKENKQGWDTIPKHLSIYGIKWSTLTMLSVLLTHTNMCTTQGLGSFDGRLRTSAFTFKISCVPYISERLVQIN